MMRGFYLILGVYDGRGGCWEQDGNWPQVLDLQTCMPTEWRMGYTVIPDGIPYVAKRAVRCVGGLSHSAYDIAAYRVTGPTTAELVWHKPAGHERGRWVRREVSNEGRVSE